MEEKIEEFDIAEAPYSLFKDSDSDCLKHLDTAYTFSVSECTTPHIRCHYLSHSDDIVQLVDDVYEASTAVMAVIFVNLSDSLFLSEAFLAPNFQTHVPLYILSQEDGDYISKNINIITECQIMLNHDEIGDHWVLNQQTSMIDSKF